MSREASLKYDILVIKRFVVSFIIVKTPESTFSAPRRVTTHERPLLIHTDHNLEAAYTQTHKSEGKRFKIRGLPSA